MKFWGFLGSGIFVASLLFGQAAVDPSLLSTKPLQNSLLETFSNIKEKTPAATPKKLKKAQLQKEIISISVEGATPDQEKLLRNALSIQLGSQVSSLRLDQEIKRVKNLGIFKDITYRFEPTKGGNNWIISVVPNPIIGEIVFEGGTLFSNEDIIAVMESKPGQLFNVKSLRSDVRAVDKYYADQGYNQAKIIRTVVPKKDGDPLIFVLVEGYIEAVTVSGNYRTKDYVILREMQTKPGDVLNDTILTEDLRRVFNLNYFANLEPRFLQGTTENAYVLNVNVEERETNAQVSFGGGYSPQQGFSVFSDLFWDNLFGTGRTILLKGQFGRANTYQFRYTDPWIFGERKSLTFKTWYTEGDVVAVNPVDFGAEAFRDERSRGHEVTIGWPVNYQVRTSHTVTLEDVTLSEVNRNYDIFSYAFGMSYDTRDFWVNPLSGVYHNFRIEQSFRFQSDALRYIKKDVNLRHFHQTFEKQTIATRASIGFLSSPDIFERELYTREFYRVGGSFSVRGYSDTNPIFFGDRRALFSTEYRFLLNRMFTVVLFADAGYATFNRNLFEFDQYRVGKGVGIRIQIPGLGPLRLDYGIGDTDSFLHFNLGHVF